MAVAMLEAAYDRKPVHRGDYEKALRSSPLTGIERAILNVVASFGDWDGSRIFPSVPTIAEASGFSERTVYRALARAEDLGYLRKVKRLARSTVYRLTVPEDVVSDPDTHDTGPCHTVTQPSQYQPSEEEAAPVVDDETAAQAEVLVCQAMSTLTDDPGLARGQDVTDAVQAVARVLAGGADDLDVYRRLVVRPQRQVDSWGAWMIARLRPLGAYGSPPSTLDTGGGRLQEYKGRAR